MKLLQILPIGKVDDGLLKDLRPAIEESLSVPCKVLPVRLDPEFAFHGDRQQYHSSEILQRMQGFVTGESWAIARGRRRRSLHSNSYLRFRRGADGRPLRRSISSPATAGVEVAVAGFPLWTGVYYLVPGTPLPPSSAKYRK
jgi:hypothetical protein